MKLANLICTAAFLLSTAFTAGAQSKGGLQYFGSDRFTVINRAFDDTPSPYSRLPEVLDPAGMTLNSGDSLVNATRSAVLADSTAMKSVWALGLNSAGIAVRFSSNAHKIGFRWTLLNDFHMAHMAGTGIRGIDLYTYEKSAKGWRFIGTAFPNGKESEDDVVSDMHGDVREYMAYLPLYDGVEKLEIGVDSGATVALPVEKMMTPEDKDARKPYVFYGTSITQGGCVSRPGMAYPAIIGRRVGCQTYNFGFSGNGRMNPSVLMEINKIDAEAFVIDCLPNCTPEIIDERGRDFIGTIARSHPGTPVYMVETVQFPPALVNIGMDSVLVVKNRKWREIYDEFRSKGMKNVRYISAEKLIGNDGEATVDGVHLTDLGTERISDAVMHVMGLDYFVPGKEKKQSPWTDVIICLGIIVIIFVASRLRRKPKE